eukprot:CAMPEP_0181226704 /NCGR_PEP_ID=MMETSP1096-20121128/32397_1 /TAXON_ID=156174 ORGANISM="Chrysochromulina ericina, Strain CCMP281" /NCGR_SAMPLE_ID=MMETSP1096 /ASSEMBLY_ACC=CAM_ASM_000453 /LENGTH=114 /DNA_ID=CAMNT_0023320061 /DNA_START=603 /DNA_END=944 /DNA_ORIENTATION=-
MFGHAELVIERDVVYPLARAPTLVQTSEGLVGVAWLVARRREGPAGHIRTIRHNVVRVRDPQHLPCGPEGQRALRHKRGVELQHRAIGHHQARVVGKWHRVRLEARLGEVSAQW